MKDLTKEKRRECFRMIRRRDLEKITKGFKYLRKFDHFAPGKKVLDIACGMGYDTITLCGEGMKGIGLDIRYDLIEKAKQFAAKVNNGAGYLVGRAEELPFEDETFDICLHSSSLEHIGEWFKCLEEAHRVLKKGGLLALGTTNKLCPLQREINNFPLYPWIPDRFKRIILAWIIKNRPDMINYSEAPAINWFTYRGLKKKLKDIGFTCLETVDLISYDYMSSKRRKLYPLLYIFKKLKPLRVIMHFVIAGVKLYCTKK